MPALNRNATLLALMVDRGGDDPASGEEPEVGIEREGGSSARSVPYDPAKIRISSRVLIVDLLMRRIINKDIDLGPDLQGAAGSWGREAQSRFIESMMIRVPIPAFYIDATDDARWLVIDGVQRLSALKAFVVDGALSLVGLEFLRQYEGMRFAELPRPMQRRIEETQLFVYLIEPGTPPEIKFNIFKRINTERARLSKAEMQRFRARMWRKIA